MTVASLGVGSLIVSVVLSVVVLNMVGRRFGFVFVPGRFRWPHVKTNLVYSVGISAASLNNEGDKTVLGANGFTAQAGLYGAAYRIVNLGMVPVSSVIHVSHRDFLVHEEGVKGQHMRRAIKFARITGLYGLAVGVALFAIAPLLPIVIGEDFEDSVTMVRWLSPLVMLRALTMFPLNALMGLGYTLFRSIVIVANAALAIVIYIVLIPDHGWKGAAAGTLISETVEMVAIWGALMWVQRREDRGIEHVSDPVEADLELIASGDSMVRFRDPDRPLYRSVVAPLVTVIMPTYERPDTTRTAIRSALDQHFDSFVLRVGDDSTSDVVRAVVGGVRRPAHRLSPQPGAPGCRGNWTHLLRSADTPYVASLNDDDQWLPEFLERLVPPLERHDDVAVSFGDFWLVDEQGRRLDHLTEELSDRTHRSTLPPGRCGTDRADGLRLVAAWNAPQPAICAVLRTSAVAGVEFPDEVRSIHDFWLSYQVVMSGGTFHYTPERLTRYRWHMASLTQTVGFADEEDYVFGRIMAENSGEPEACAEVVAYWAFIRWGRAVTAMGAGDAATSQHELRAAAAHLGPVQRIVAEVGGTFASRLAGIGLVALVAHPIQSLSRGDEERNESER